MTKADIVEQIYEQVGFSKKESAELVEKVFEAIKETLAEGEKVKISGFGNFVVRDKNSRKGRNPQTGQEILLEARKVLKAVAERYGHTFGFEERPIGGGAVDRCGGTKLVRPRVATGVQEAAPGLRCPHSGAGQAESRDRVDPPDDGPDGHRRARADAYVQEC